MKKFSRYLLITFTTMMLFTLASCDDKEDVEFNLPGTWYTEQEIDFGATVWGKGTVMTFNQNHQGTIGTSIDYIYFNWRWLNDYSFDTTMELCFEDGTYAYIKGADAGARTFEGTWYNSYADFSYDVDGQYFRMKRAK